MSEFTIDTSQLVRLQKSLGKSGKRFDKGIALLFKKIGVLVQGLSRKYSPESQTIGMYAAQNKSGVTNRKRSSITTGSLRDSIMQKAGKNFVSIFVLSNSRAGKYAEKIHDKKGSEWENRGPRTKQKGAKADEKYIYRAYADSEADIDRMVDEVIDKFAKGIGV